KNEDREAFLFCPNSHYSGKKTDYQTNKQKKTNIKRDVCLHSEQAKGLLSGSEGVNGLLDKVKGLF
ncbi:hypothetical protein ACTGUZ_10235, partial [Streptococcus suis]|uniref:hypothetical protein n=1 Tax=Streptococcus sp. 2021WUSS109 TaxID=2983282 RepID=UPI0037D951B7